MKELQGRDGAEHRTTEYMTLAVERIQRSHIKRVLALQLRHNHSRHTALLCLKDYDMAYATIEDTIGAIDFAHGLFAVTEFQASLLKQWVLSWILGVTFVTVRVDKKQRGDRK